MVGENLKGNYDITLSLCLFTSTILIHASVFA